MIWRRRVPIVVFGYFFSFLFHSLFRYPPFRLFILSIFSSSIYFLFMFVVVVARFRLKRKIRRNRKRTNRQIMGYLIVNELLRNHFPASLSATYSTEFESKKEEKEKPIDEKNQWKWNDEKRKSSDAILLNWKHRTARATQTRKVFVISQRTHERLFETGNNIFDRLSVSIVCRMSTTVDDIWIWLRPWENCFTSTL